MPAELEELFAAFREGLRGILGDELLAVYIFGSAVTGDFHAASSDVDFLVITERRLDEASVQRLSKLHRNLAAQFDWGRRLEGGYAARDQVRPWGLDGSIAAIEPGGLLRAGVPSEHGPSNMMAMREAGRALVGPPATMLLPEVDAPTLERGVRGYLEELLARGEGERSGIDELAACTLNIARCLYALVHRRPSAKDEAARWLAQEQPQLEPVLTAALAVRSGNADQHAVRVLASGFRDLQTEAKQVAQENALRR